MANFIKIFSLLLFATIFPLAIMAESQEILRVGAILPLSGSAAVYGQSGRNGFELALQEMSIKKIQVVYEDDQYSPAKAVAAFHKLTQLDKVDVVVGMASTPSNAVAPLAEKARIPFIAWANDPKVSRGRQFVFISAQTATDEGRFMAQEASRRKYRDIAVISAVGDFQSAVVDGFKQVLEKKLLIMEEEVSSSENDFRSVLVKAKQREIKSFMLCLHPGQFGVIAKQARQLGIQADFFGCDTMQDSKENTISDGALSQAWYAGFRTNPEFDRKYTAAYGNQSIIAAAATYYEVAKILAELADVRRDSLLMLRKLLSLGRRSGALGDFEVVRRDNVQSFDIPTVVQTFPPKS